MVARWSPVSVLLIILVATFVLGDDGRKPPAVPQVGIVDMVRVIEGDTKFRFAADNLLRREEQLKRKGADESQLDLITKEAQELTKLTSIRLEGIVRDVALRKGLHVVLRRDARKKKEDIRDILRAEDRLVIFASKEVDITDSVIEEANSR